MKQKRLSPWNLRMASGMTLATLGCKTLLRIRVVSEKKKTGRIDIGRKSEGKSGINTDRLFLFQV